MAKLTSELLTVTIYMRGGHKVVVNHVVSVTMTRGNTGDYSGYEIIFNPDHQPSLFTLSIPDIVGVVAERMLLGMWPGLRV
jgi:hypothetical protein